MEIRVKRRFNLLVLIRQSFFPPRLLPRLIPERVLKGRIRLEWPIGLESFEENPCNHRPIIIRPSPWSPIAERTDQLYNLICGVAAPSDVSVGLVPEEVS